MKTIIALLAIAALAGCIHTERKYYGLEYELEFNRLEAFHYSNQGDELGFEM